MLLTLYLTCKSILHLLVRFRGLNNQPMVLVHTFNLPANPIVRSRGLSRNWPVPGSFSCLLIGECSLWHRLLGFQFMGVFFRFQITKSNIQEATFYSFFLAQSFPARRLDPPAGIIPLGGSRLQLRDVVSQILSSKNSVSALQCSRGNEHEPIT